MARVQNRGLILLCEFTCFQAQFAHTDCGCLRYAATSPDVEKNGWNGVYLNDVVSAPCLLLCLILQQTKSMQAQLGKESSQASDPALGTDLWELSESTIREKLGSDALVDWNS